MRGGICCLEYKALEYQTFAISIFNKICFYLLSLHKTTSTTSKDLFPSLFSSKNYEKLIVIPCEFCYQPNKWICSSNAHRVTMGKRGKILNLEMAKSWLAFHLAACILRCDIFFSYHYQQSIFQNLVLLLCSWSHWLVAYQWDNHI